MRFPTYAARDLNGDRKTLPDDFGGSITLAIIAYQQWQQREVDSWVPLLAELEESIDGFRYVELPVVGEMSFLGRKSLDFFMRSGIRDRQTRSRTITLYVNRVEFRRQLGIETENTIALILVNQTGEVIWQALGPHTAETAQALEEALRAARPNAI